MWSFQQRILLVPHFLGSSSCLLHQVYLCRCTSIQMSPGPAILFKQLKMLDLTRS